MSTGILSKIYQESQEEYIIRQNAIEVWTDLFRYAKNLNGNWMLSQEIFNTHIAPTALYRPEYFADCVEEMVKVSGLKVKCQSKFKKSIKALKNLKNKTIEADKIIYTLTDMLNAGLYEPLYAEKALSTVSI